jgi:DNA (cytosine-5)-methyltransferase 1
MKDNNIQYKLIDLFCGAGGMSLGFSKKYRHSFKHVWANDIEEACAKTYNTNFGDVCVIGDIEEILADPNTIIPDADVVIGGPPCQGFSLLNKNRSDDPRKQLWRPFLEIVKRSNSVVFVMENVPYILGTHEHHQIIESAQKLGFKVWSDKLCSADYGVPQTRIRAFIIGSKVGDPHKYFPPLKTNFNKNGNGKGDFVSTGDSYTKNAKPWKTVRDAIGKLPKPVGTEIRNTSPPLNLQFGRTPTEKSLERYKAIPKEGMNRFDLQKNAPELTPECWIRKTTGGTDLFGRLWWDKPAFTIRTEFFKPEKGRYLHPQQNRPITHREAARLSSFPDDFIFTGSKIEIAKQIGNAVPPKLAASVADSILKMLVTKK